MVLGQLASAVQALGAFQSILVEWPEPLATLLELTQLLMFDIEVLRGECALGRDDPVDNYASRLLAYPFFAAVFDSGAFLCSRAAPGAR